MHLQRGNPGNGKGSNDMAYVLRLTLRVRGADAHRKAANLEKLHVSNGMYSDADEQETCLERSDEQGEPVRWIG